MKIVLIIFLSILVCQPLFSQVEVLPTGTANNLTHIEQVGTITFIYGNRYLGKCYGNCDTVFAVDSIPGMPGGMYTYRTSSFAAADTNILLLMYTRIFANFGENDFWLYKSFDGGNSWSLIIENHYADEDNTDVHMFDENEGVIMSAIGVVQRTMDGGKNWQKESKNFAAFSSETFGDSTIACIGYSNFKFCISDDRNNSQNCYTLNGASFTSINFSPRIFFLSRDTIFVTVMDSSYEFPALAYSFDGGKAWNYNKFPGFFPKGIFFLSSNEGYVLEWNRIYRTLDRGKTWGITYPGLNTRFEEMKFLNDSIALIVGTNGVVCKWNKNAANFTVVSVEEKENHKAEISLSPNPSVENVHISVSAQGNNSLSIELYDISGRKIRSLCTQKVFREEVIISDNVASLNEGIYIYRIELNDRIYHKKLIR